MPTDSVQVEVRDQVITLTGEVSDTTVPPPAAGNGARADGNRSRPAPGLRSVLCEKDRALWTRPIRPIRTPGREAEQYLGPAREETP